MKGLLIKDFSLFALNKKIFIIFAAVAVMFVFVGDTSTNEFIVTFASAYMSVMCGLQVLSTITYDEFDNSSEYLMTLPISRTVYVAEKYLFTIIMSAAGALAAFVITGLGCTVGGASLDWVTLILGTAASTGGIFALLALMIPLQLKFGGDNGRIVIFIITAIILLISFGIKKIGSAMGIDIDKVIESIETIISDIGQGTIIFSAVAAAIVFVGISFAISLKVVRNKEY